MKLCPCGSKKLYSACCGIFISGKKTPETPEALMRSRYSAYTRANINYIERTMKAAAAEKFDAQSAKAWAQRVKWLGLKVLQTHASNHHGTVEFIAYYSDHGKKQHLHEVSEFVFENGQWYYVAGNVN